MQIKIISDQENIETEVNKFCKNHDVINVIPSVATVGNNPPTTIMIYTILYNEKQKAAKKTK